MGNCTCQRLFFGKKGKERAGEDRTISDASIDCGDTMKEIADPLELHDAAISRAIKRVEERGKA
jgi:hypothetical protein